MDATTNGMPLPMYTAPSSPEEQAWLTIPEHAALGGFFPLCDPDDNWRKSEAKVLVHNRLGRGLAMFTSTRELLCVFADAADAHQQALDKANILHRNVSPGSILITDEGKGVLVDWDVHERVDGARKDASHPERTGTFQFSSTRFVSTQYNFGPHDRKDDVESFFHTLQWIVLRFVDCEMDPIELGETLHSIFDATTPGPKGLTRCRGRLDCLRNSIWETYSNLQDVLRVLEDLRKVINSRYILAEDMDRVKEDYERYLTLQKQLDSDPAQGNPDKIENLESKRRLAQPAILYEDLGNANWFRERLKNAANEYRLDLGPASTPQKYERVSIEGAKKITISENSFSNRVLRSEK